MLIVFDLGGVLVRVARTWDQAVARAGVTCASPNQTAGLAACPQFEGYQAGSVDEATYLEALRTWLDLDSTDDARGAHNGILLEPYPGSETIVARLIEDGHDVAMLSNTNDLHWVVMSDGAGLTPHIASIPKRFLSHELQDFKPNESIFRTVERETGRAPHEIIYFEDTAVNLDAARACGWQAVAIDPFGDTASQIRAALAERGITA